MKSVSLIALVLFAFAALSSTSARSSLRPRIINGHNATEGQFPHMVSLRTRSLQHYCGASILSNRFLLTAAHCCVFFYGDPKNLVAVVGALRLSQGGVVHELDAYVAHEKFNFTNMTLSIYDVAVIRTAKEIVFTDLIQPIALPKADLPTYDRSIKVVVSGWGLIEVEPEYKLPDRLQYIELDTLDTTECAKRFASTPSYKNAVQKGHICTVNSVHGGVCDGDSGSGLIDLADPNHKTLVGITSWAFCGQDAPNVFLRIYSQLDWIQEQIAKLSSGL